MARYYSNDKRSVFAADGSIDMDRLTKEMGSNLYEDKRYHNVDEMKKKAIHTSRDYDEFKNFVACASDMLQPVSSAEFQELTKGRQGWKHTAGNRATTTTAAGPGVVGRAAASSAAASKKTLAADLAVAPSGPGDFERMWRRCRSKKECETEKRRRDYLSRHPPAAFAEVWKRDLDATLACEVLRTVAALSPDEDDQVVGLLEAVATSPRFALNVMFLDEKDKTALADLFQALDDRDPPSANTAELRTLYGLPPGPKSEAA